MNYSVIATCSQSSHELVHDRGEPVPVLSRTLLPQCSIVSVPLVVGATEHRGGGAGLDDIQVFEGRLVWQLIEDPVLHLLLLSLLQFLIKRLQNEPPLSLEVVNLILQRCNFDLLV